MSSLGYDDLDADVTRGQIALDKLQYVDAEAAFRDVLRRLQSNPPPPCSVELIGGGVAVTWQELANQKAERLTVAALEGLAETFGRQTKTIGSGTDDDDGQWTTEATAEKIRLMMHSLTLHRDVAELARRSRRQHRGRLSNDDEQFFEDTESLALTRYRSQNEHRHDQLEKSWEFLSVVVWVSTDDRISVGGRTKTNRKHKAFCHNKQVCSVGAIN